VGRRGPAGEGHPAAGGRGLIHLLAHWLGLDNPAGPIYAFYSGSGSFILKGSIIVVLWHHLNCREPGCKRLGRHHLGGFCRKHRKET
jgi:hypothetical protein